MNSPSVLTFKNIPKLSVLEHAYPGLTAIFFDMDGTLFNTESYHTQALLKIGQDYKIRPPYDAQEVHSIMMGKADYLVFDIAKSWEGFPKDWSVEDFVNEKNRNLLKILSNTKASEYFPDETRKLLGEIKARKIFLALVTSSEKVITEKLLTFANVLSDFDLVLTRDDCLKHKPEPWPYLKAMEAAKKIPAETLIFEDSDVGILAARNSGAHVIKVEWF